MSDIASTPIPDSAILALISDSDFRTYVLVCHLAWRAHPSAERPYTELGYEDLAALHPGPVLIKADAVRARIQRLVKAGLLVRERIDNVRWRTYPSFAQSQSVSETPMGASWDHTHRNATPTWLRSGITPNGSKNEMGAMPDSAQPMKNDLDATVDHTHREGQTNWVRSDIAPRSSQMVLGVNWDRTQQLERPLGAIPASTQCGKASVSDMADSTYSPDLTDLLIDDQDQYQLSDQISAESHGNEALAAALAGLKPDGMSQAGIAECLHHPELTQAWLAFVSDAANGVKRPAAYLRKQVRSGKFPPNGGKQSPTERSVYGQTGQLESWHHGRLQRGRVEATVRTDPGMASLPASLALATETAPRWPLDAG